MRSIGSVGKFVVVILLASGLLFKTGCGGSDFGWLEDYQRDLLFGGLALAVLLGD